jgi:hypothetical protein
MIQSRFKKTKLFRYVVGAVGAGQFVIGTFVSAHKGIEEIDEARMLGEVQNTYSYYKDSLRFEKTKVVSNNCDSSSSEVVAGSVVIDANQIVNILDSNNCSSVTDAGSHEVVVNFAEPLGNYIFSVITSEPLKLVKIDQKPGSLGLHFDKPYSGTVKVVFFEQVLMPSSA